MAMMDILSKFKRSGKATDLGTFAMVHVLTCTYMYNTRCIHIYMYIGNAFGIHNLDLELPGF